MGTNLLVYLSKQMCIQRPLWSDKFSSVHEKYYSKRSFGLMDFWLSIENRKHTICLCVSERARELSTVDFRCNSTHQLPTVFSLFVIYFGVLSHEAVCAFKNMLGKEFSSTKKISANKEWILLYYKIIIFILIFFSEKYKSQKNNTVWCGAYGHNVRISQRKSLVIWRNIVFRINRFQVLWSVLSLARSLSLHFGFVEWKHLGKFSSRSLTTTDTPLQQVSTNYLL